MAFEELLRSATKERVVIQVVLDPATYQRAQALARTLGQRKLGKLWRCAVLYGLADIERKVRKL